MERERLFQTTIGQFGATKNQFLWERFLRNSPKWSIAALVGMITGAVHSARTGDIQHVVKTLLEPFY